MKLIECPRDAMQGIKAFIPTELKIEYLNRLLNVGFDTLDFGSFVSPKAIPQLQDTVEVLKGLNLSATRTKLLAIIANVRGAQEACAFDEIAYLGFPFSISETFQQRNANASITESLGRVEDIHQLCLKHNKELVVYISMAFGNPYGDEWNTDIAIKWAYELNKRGIKILALSDTIGSSTPESITTLFSALIPELKNVEFGAHLHATKDQAFGKIKAAYEAGCRRFDAAIHGFGGCPMAKEELTGNIATEEVENFMNKNGVNLGLNLDELQLAYAQSWKVFNNYH